MLLQHLNTFTRKFRLIKLNISLTNTIKFSINIKLNITRTYKQLYPSLSVIIVGVIYFNL